MNELAITLQRHGWFVIVHGPAGTVMGSPDGDDSLFIHPMSTGLAVDSWPVEVVQGTAATAQTVVFNESNWVADMWDEVTA